ncbi:DSD1 family PLP-dependent enzyme [Bermanella marisrubri]|uniref:Alanine racemase-like protein n=1 Tax=Bermanella marisrubri TaxID=207949 RepID=Q1N1T9_9GAMM|nr:DSD1 family PLP-dependent enzyme [Bermanella marisrubri]EAT12192.1 Alanine racemase-like protein [Oceanobacter sp. RED65] [Bermanella marisrubri]QIZ83665.1 DSD1 family PLP-dependent enzyme [Bermanella marisrubri]
MKLSRRQFMLLSSGTAAAVALPFIKPSDNGEGGHSPYFQEISKALKEQSIGTPRMLVDYDQLLQNVKTLTGHIKPRFDYRIVAKSLPSIELLQVVMKAADTNRLMLFHQPFLSQVAKRLPDADILMGKPMPIQAVERFYQDGIHNDFVAAQQIQWLVDSPQRLEQYREFAESNKLSMAINIELDVGLHRGGITRDSDLISMLDMIETSDTLNFSGFMGYEPHIGKVPGDVLDHRDKAMAEYQHYVQLTEQHLKRSIQHLTLNAGGSPTYQYYNQGQWPMNELSAGSCLVKPTDFDLASLQDHEPACYIASPVIKQLDQAEIPGIDFMGELLSSWDPNLKQAFFIYGGYWKAKPESPKGLKLNPVYGRSTNQEMLNGSDSVQLKQDDYVFLRPTQSESVMLQFGDLLVYRKGQLIDHWPILKG